MQAAVYAMMLLNQEVAMNQAPEGAPCAVNDDCESYRCNMFAIPHVCYGDEVVGGTGQSGDPCSSNSDCFNGHCSYYTHVCGGWVSAKAAEGESCETNDDCESAWCNMWAIPHICGGDEVKAVEERACIVNGDCEVY